MKRIAAVLLGLMMAFAACMASAEAVAAKSGDELSFDISIFSASGTDAKIGIKTNGAPVTFVRAAGGEVNDVVPPQAFDGFFALVNDDGITISADGSSISGTATGLKALANGKIGTLTFRVNGGAAPGTYTVEAYKKEGAVTVAGSLTFTISQQVAGERIPGDANMDGSVDARDALLIAKYAADWQGLTIDLENAEVNGDGSIDARDALAIAKYAAGWDVVLK